MLKFCKKNTFLNTKPKGESLGGQKMEKNSWNIPRDTSHDLSDSLWDIYGLLVKKSATAPNDVVRSEMHRIAEEIKSLINMIEPKKI